MTIAQYAKRFPNALVRLTFANAQGTGALVTTAADALLPNQSQRFFPPANLCASDLGWPRTILVRERSYRLEPRIMYDAFLEKMDVAICGLEAQARFAAQGLPHVSKRDAISMAADYAGLDAFDGTLSATYDAAFAEAA